MKYRKKPVEIEAKLFNAETLNQVFNWASQIQGNVTPDWDENQKPILKIPTNEGVMICSLGDYLIKEPFPTNARRLYPCKPEMFKLTYDKIEE